ncbi:hypothetical protein FHX37_1961 [Haloactinospora alba]|uniref:Uncharacterized protein n=1 Tax=Haloactinospora alba TaxID=405555 RepID=A0A543NJQ6_9ACTN|nr:hypothetical protein FHX37_1961 [Haloactinospora alba]
MSCPSGVFPTGTRVFGPPVENAYSGSATHAPRHPAVLHARGASGVIPPRRAEMRAGFRYANAATVGVSVAVRERSCPWDGRDRVAVWHLRDLGEPYLGLS